MGRSRTTPGCPKGGLDDPNCAPRSPRNALGQLQRRSWNTPARSGAPPKRFCSAARCANSSQNDFFSFFVRRATSPMCVPHYFFRCFVDFARSCTHTHARDEKPRKNHRFGLENRAPGRPRRVWTAWSHAKSAQSSGKTHPERAGPPIFLEKPARRGWSSAKRRATRRFQGARPRRLRGIVKEYR